MIASRFRARIRPGSGAISALLLVPSLLLAQSGPDQAGPKQRTQKTEAELLRQLQQDAVEIDIHAKAGYAKELVMSVRPPEPAKGQAAKPRRRSSPAHTLAQLKQRDDLHGLPMREEPDCKKAAVAARLMEQVSSSVRDTTTQYLGATSQGLAVRHANENGLLAPLARVADSFSRPQVITLLQMFQPQGPAVRKKLVELLGAWDDPQASIFLAQRAIYDLSPEVRAMAVAALRNRKAKEYRQVLLEGLRYPWAPVADHAAEALAALRDQDAVSDLVSLLDKPDPRRPLQEDKKRTVVAELVALNHLRNCLLCHAPSFDDSDPVRGVVPEPGQPLTPRYYDSDGSRTITIFARADITYLKQDFSVFQPVARADPWPKEQRFDYLIRRREATADDFAKAKETATYPQREAVLFALRELTGEDHGASSADWRSLVATKKVAREPR